MRGTGVGDVLCRVGLCVGAMPFGYCTLVLFSRDGFDGFEGVARWVLQGARSATEDAHRAAPRRGSTLEVHFESSGWMPIAPLGYPPVS